MSENNIVSGLNGKSKYDSLVKSLVSKYKPDIFLPSTININSLKKLNSYSRGLSNSNSDIYIIYDYDCGVCQKSSKMLENK